MPPELKAPIQANLSRLFSPVSSDSDPPMESPAIARELRSLVTRYSLSTFGMTSVSKASRKFEKFLSRTSVWLHAPHPRVMISMVPYPSGITTIIGFALPCAIRLSRITLARPTAVHPLASSL